jgi:hypothetical protein
MKQLFFWSWAMNIDSSLSCAKESIMIPKTTFKMIVVISKKKAISNTNLM